MSDTDQTLLPLYLRHGEVRLRTTFSMMQIFFRSRETRFPSPIKSRIETFGLPVISSVDPTIDEEGSGLFLFTILKSDLVS